jgi:hypothetical protein
MNLRLLALSLAAAVVAACTSGTTDKAKSSEAPVKNPAEAPEIPPLEETSLANLGAYALPLQRSPGYEPKLTPGVVVYTPRYQLWSDGATKRRFVQLPKGEKIRVDASGAWTFPTGTRIYKEFYKGGYLHETRVIEKTAAGFRIATYLWNEAGTEATLDMAGGTVGSGETQHSVPSQRECAGCHNDDKNPVLGLSFVQLNPEMSTEDKDALFVEAPAPFVWRASATTEMQTTLGYLHANCGHCHSDADDGSTFLSLRPSDSGDGPEHSAMDGIRSFADTRLNGDLMLILMETVTMPRLGVTVADPRVITPEGDIRKGIQAIIAAPPTR